MIKSLTAALLALLVSTGVAAAQTCGAMPYTLTNGQTADASQVMADLNYVLNCISPAPVGTARGLKAQQTSATTLTLTADEVIVETALGGTAYRVVSPNLTLNIASVGANGMDTGSAPTSGDLSVYLIYNPSTGTAALLGVNGATSNGPVYTGSSMPAGYTASALVSSLKTNGSAQLNPLMQIDRTVSIQRAVALSGGYTTALTPISLSSIVPANARTVGGNLSPPDGNVLVLYSDLSGTGQVTSDALGNPGTIYAPFSGLAMRTPQTIYYNNNVSSGLTGGEVTISSYTF